MRKIRIGLVGAGRMGSFHGNSIARKIHGAKLTAIATPRNGAAERLSSELGVSKTYTDLREMFEDPSIDAVIIATPAHSHVELIVAAANEEKSIFCEKSMAITLEEADKAILAAQKANVPLQVGFNRRFAAGFRAAHDDIVKGRIGTPQLLRSLTRDPGLGDPISIPEWAIFLETLVHDFDTLLYLNPGAETTEVYAVADALVRPDFKDKGLLDTAVANIRFDNGAIATAEANFQAVYGYDVRSEVFGSAGSAQQTNMIRYTAEGISSNTYRQDTDLFHDAYVAELTSFVECVRTRNIPYVTGKDVRRALSIAHACIESIKTNVPVKIKDNMQLV